MQSLQQLRIQYKSQIMRLAAQYRAYNVRVFGSLARSEAQADSDIDFLVEFDEQASLLDQGGLLMDLQDLLGCRVDVIDEHAMRPRFRAQVLKDAVPL